MNCVHVSFSVNVADRLQGAKLLLIVVIFFCGVYQRFCVHVQTVLLGDCESLLFACNVFRRSSCL